MDEPTIGLDPNQIRNIRELIRLLSEEYTVLISTHILSEVEMLCERVLIMDRGMIVASDSPASLVSLMKGNEHVSAEVTGPHDKVAEVFRSLSGVESVVCDELTGGWNRLECKCSKESAVRAAMFDAVCSHKWQLRELSVEKRRLEDVFVAITHGEITADTAKVDKPEGEILNAEEEKAEESEDKSA